MSRISRRAVITSATIVPVAALTATAQEAGKPASVFSPAQMKTLEAFIDRLIPSDETGPGAVEAGAQNYIDRQLAGYLAAEKTAFLAGLDDLDAYARRTQAKAFAELNRTYEERLYYPAWLKADPSVDSLRDDPRFQELLKEVRFPQ